MSNKKHPIVSVILPFFNAEDTINRAILSIAKQTLTNFECILINNNSTDKSQIICNEWVACDPRFKLISESRQGVMFASNAGAAIAKGNYIARMDADDFSYPDRLEKQVAYLEKNTEVGVVAGLVDYVAHNENSTGFARYVEWVNSIQSAHDIFIKRFIEMPIVNPSIMWRKAIGIKHGLYKHGEFPEDYEMCLRWLHDGVKIHKLENKVLKWYDSECRLTRSNNIYSDSAFYRIKTSYLAKWLVENRTLPLKFLVWGASKTSRDHAAYLKVNGIKIERYIDIKKSRQIDENIMYYEELPSADKYFILIYIKHSAIRKKVSAFLINKGYSEGDNFLFMS